MLIPLWFAWLMFAVYREPGAVLGSVPEPAVEEPPPEVETELERPKVMAAGRRRPLP
jgi:hypothetical protein